MEDAAATAASLQLKERAQTMAASASAASLRARQSRMAAPGQTGLPAQLKAGIASLSGIGMDHVQVHYNSARPAQLQAHAYAQGSQIHVGPGQERHLPHEAWHVVQQAQGRVRPTLQMKGNVPVNDDAGLENEADVMGRRALAHGSGHRDEETAGALASAGGLSDSGPVQMAGHAEDLCFVGKWLVKRADSIEIAQYTSGEVPVTAPVFHGPFYTAAEALTFLHDAGEHVAADNLAKINLMAEPMQHGGKGFMMLANATTGMAFPKMRDLKMGKHSADDADQERHGVTGLSKGFKLERHAAMDWQSGSSERGYRDEDRWKSSMLGDNLDQLRTMLERASLTALQMICHDLKKFQAWLGTTKVVYVGMSVLVVAGGEQGKAVAIDFEHPVRDNEESFTTHLKGLLVGVDNLLTLVGDLITSFAARAEQDEAQRRVLAEIDRRARTAVIRNQGGSINNSDEGNAGIGDYDL